MPGQRARWITIAPPAERPRSPKWIRDRARTGSVQGRRQSRVPLNADVAKGIVKKLLGAAGDAVTRLRISGMTTDGESDVINFVSEQMRVTKNVRTDGRHIPAAVRHQAILEAYREQLDLFDELYG